MKQSSQPPLQKTQLLGEDALIMSHTGNMNPFLMQLISDSDVWMYIGSNHAICAGRKNPDHSLFPYYTQDKMFDMIHASGSLSLLEVTHNDSGETHKWRPFSGQLSCDSTIQQSVIKSVSGTKISLEELHTELHLRFRITWTSSKTHGVIRLAECFNESDQTYQIRILDGIQNIMPPGIDQLFQNTFSNLADAYKQSEWIGDEIALYSLSSIPTDKAEPNECLKATMVYSFGFPTTHHFLSNRAISQFNKGEELQDEYLNRGTRGSYLLSGELTLQPNSSHSWYLIADVDLSAAQILERKDWIQNTTNLRSGIEEAIDVTTQNLNTMVGKLDGSQQTQLINQCSRHFSNTLFNMMRGGTFPNEYKIPKADLASLLQVRNRPLYDTFANWIQELPNDLDIKTLKSAAAETGNIDLCRIVNEYLPLSFSRRHGDPSRPWNRFNIDVTTETGETRYAYQGNWRDIFQNWEALLYSFPLYTESVIHRFLNATTFDGYNPYRITQDGFDWERLEPDSPWSNIGYWGDHQIVYLLKLLELSYKLDPTQLQQRLSRKEYAFAAVPYRIKSIDDVIGNARDSISYDDAWSDKIDATVEQKGTDGQLVTHADGSIVYANLAEKLLIPMLAKMSNFVPDAGIWMNTQRPEWNDANNALAGYGASVVTAGYLLRYVRFLRKFLAGQNVESLELHSEVFDLLEAIASVLPPVPSEEKTDATVRGMITRKLGEAGTQFRSTFYNSGIEPSFTEISLKQLLDALQVFEFNIESTLKNNERDDHLYHSYNLLHFREDGAVEIEYLCLMLEGQVSILSSGIIGPKQTLQLLEALQTSDLFRNDQDSFLLYPNRDLPKLLSKGVVDISKLEPESVLHKEISATHSAYIEKAPDGTIRFKGSFHNASLLKEKMEKDQLNETAKKQMLDAYEATFHHHSFTGRSRSFFAYEGLGSIYWHMVSKLLLAVQEIIMEEETHPSSDSLKPLVDWYHRIKKGIGADKTPQQYGAFPTDPYSHTPAHSGAQQPGMTGQVKEDFISRQHELGLRIKNGQLSFSTTMLTPEEYLKDPAEWSPFGLDASESCVELPENSVGFTVCNTPVVIKSESGTKPSVTLMYTDGHKVEKETTTLDSKESQAVFARDHALAQIQVSI